jgi:LytS/YehU family sensor histidine kinase
VNEMIKGAYLDIKLTISGSSASLLVRNNYKIKSETVPEEKRTGIGLVNLRRRLELFYPGRHMLTVNRTAFSYEAQLTIQMA